MTNGAGGGKHGHAHTPKLASSNSKVSKAKKTAQAAGSARGKVQASATTRA